MTEIMPCDIHKEHPLGRPIGEEAKYDLVIASFCLVVACLDVDEYKKAWQRLATLVKPGWHIIVMDTLDETMYSMGGVNLSAVTVSMETVNESVQAARLEMVKSNVDIFSGYGADVSDASKWYCTVAKKI